MWCFVNLKLVHEGTTNSDEKAIMKRKGIIRVSEYSILYKVFILLQYRTNFNCTSRVKL